MLNYPIALKWANSCKRPDAWKTVGKLARINRQSGQESNCCLGNLARMCKVPVHVEFEDEDQDEVIIKFHNKIYNNILITSSYSSDFLPNQLCKLLNMNNAGELTVHGQLLAMKYFNVDNTSQLKTLTEINDDITKDDTTLYRIGCFIEWCLAEEQLFGRECFDKSHYLE